MSHEPTASTAAAGQADDWARLCMLLDDDPELAPAVRLAVTDPQGYLHERAAEPAVPGLGHLLEADPWQALLDGLDDAGALAYLDPGDFGMELAEALAGLPRVVGAGVDLDQVTDLDGELATVVGVADRLLGSRGLRIVQLEEEAQACPLVVVPTGHVPQILDLVARLGQVARDFSGR